MKNKDLRFDVLDGLRGFSMILVFLNHIDSLPFVAVFPPSLQPFVQVIFSSGKIGISFFFILSGFLMGYLYRNPQPAAFIRKRYARIFPVFIVMVLAMTVFRQMPQLSLFLRIVTIVALAFLGRTIWIAVERFKFGPTLITLFQLLQAAVFVWYGFFIMRHPPVWFSGLPLILKEGTISAANATLTLPLGDYLPLIDGVYWSLIPEVLFYLVYPYLFAPAANRLQKKSILTKLLFSLSLFPLFFGMALLFKHVRGMGMLFIEYFMYFCVGIAAARLAYGRRPTLPRAIRVLFNPFLFFVLLVCAHFTQTGTTGEANLAVKLLWSVPFGAVVYYLLDETSTLHKFFVLPFIKFIGIISFSVYIVHTSMVDGMHTVFRPGNAIMNILFILTTFAVTLFVAYLLHLIIERLYFRYKEEKTVTKYQGGRYALATVISVAVFILLFFTGYASRYNFFSSEYSYGKENAMARIPENAYPLSGTPLRILFTSPENNLGIVSFHLTAQSRPAPASAIMFKQQEVEVSLRENGNPVPLAVQKTNTAEIGQSNAYPFGFPPIPSSQGKQYEVRLSLVNPNPYTTVLLHTDSSLMTSVHQLDKKSLLTHPASLVSHLAVKIRNILGNGEALLVLMCLVPYFAIALYLSFSR